MRIWGIIISFLITIDVAAQIGCVGFENPSDSIKVFRHRELYKDHIKKGQHEEAIYFWEYIYVNAPGSFEGLYVDGIELFKHLYQTTKDQKAKQLYLERIFEIYDFRTACYPNKKGYILCRKGYDMAQLNLDKFATFETFRRGVGMEQYDTESFALPPYAKVTQTLFESGDIDNIERIQTKKLLESIALHHINNNSENSSDYETALAYVKKYFNSEATSPTPLADAKKRSQTKTRGCEYYIARYRAKIEANPHNQKLKKLSYKELKALGCGDSNDWVNSLAGEITKNNVSTDWSEKNSVKSVAPLTEANYALKMGDYEGAIVFYKQAIKESNDNQKRSQLHLKIGEITFYKLKDPETANFHVLESTKFNSNWGKPYLLLGDLYLGSVKECYPDDAVMQKLIIQAAINQWRYARTLDSGMTKDATERIQKYSYYLPTRSEVFLHPEIKEGKTIKIGCWIQQKVKVKVK